jgi:hypothetical protein
MCSSGQAKAIDRFTVTNCIFNAIRFSANLSKTFGTTLPATRYGELLSKGAGHGTDDGA